FHDDGAYHVALFDFGYKQNILRNLVKRGCKVSLVPAHTSAEQIKALGADGIMLSNGPGDPAENTAIIAELTQIAALGTDQIVALTSRQIGALSTAGVAALSSDQVRAIEVEDLAVMKTAQL
ncbi:MAG: hypothetical protein RR215_06200, partial [Ruthenibacterium sp.]